MLVAQTAFAISILALFETQPGSKRRRPLSNPDALSKQPFTAASALLRKACPGWLLAAKDFATIPERPRSSTEKRINREKTKNSLKLPKTPLFFGA
ncbi:hypothetical protein [Rubinisphaera sp. JC750]|uniref:hypothetical protein n=1 Tax=Rubinisphaera sp. JC750 TaxID=2898658 RepID=UPI001F1D534B|nr:hypothetical protein [Rubinisphaera sp. JC750]